MELLQSKLPFMSPNWTMARGLKYVARLGIFVIVPGLHQITCNRRILGGLIMVLYFGAEFTSSNLPYRPSYYYHGYPHMLAMYLAEYIRYFVFVLLVLDLKQLENRKLNFDLFLMGACAVGIYFVPFHHPGVQTVFVESKNTVCPAFCKDDIIEFDYRSFEDLWNYQKETVVPVGDYVAINVFDRNPYTTIVLADPDDVCSGLARRILPLKDRWYYCADEYDNTPPYPYLVLGGAKPEYRGYNGQDISMVGPSEMSGINPRKIGNIREYFIYSDHVTVVVGHVLLVVYEMTGLNLFGISKSP
jgi:hypothetical protein